MNANPLKIKHRKLQRSMQC